MGRIDDETEARLALALDFIQNHDESTDGKLKITSVADQFNVNYHQLYARTKGHRRPKGRPATHRLFTDAEESGMVQDIMRLDAYNFPVTVDVISALANDILRERCPLGEEPRLVGSRWAARFLVRHGHHALSQKQLDAKRKKAQDKEQLAEWFTKLQKVMRENSIDEKDVWNVDESGFRMVIADSEKVVTKEPKLPKRPAFEDRETATVIEAVSSIGQTIPLYVIFRGQEQLANWNASPDVKIEMRIQHSITGYTNDQIQLDWLDHFQLHIADFEIFGGSGRRLLLLDGYNSHCTREFIDKCRSYDIIPFAFPAHATHHLQPLDVDVFQPVKTAYSDLLLGAHRDGFTSQAKETFLSGLSLARATSLQPEVIKSAFAKAGIVPFAPDVILSKLPDHPDEEEGRGASEADEEDSQGASEADEEEDDELQKTIEELQNQMKKKDEEQRKMDQELQKTIAKLQNQMRKKDEDQRKMDEEIQKTIEALQEHMKKKNEEQQKTIEELRKKNEELQKQMEETRSSEADEEEGREAAEGGGGEVII